MKIFIGFVFVIVGAVALALFYCTSMPGESGSASTASSGAEGQELADKLKDTCEYMSHVIGQRSSVKMLGLGRAREYIEGRLHHATLSCKEKEFISRADTGVNLEVEIEGTTARQEVLVLGAHYDTASYTPGADDNASGCAMLIEIAHALTSRSHDRTIDIVFFDRGSSRYASTDETGSHAWAADAKKNGKKIAAMLSLDSVDCFFDEPGTQGGPFPLSLCYPGQGNFLLFAGELSSRDLVRTCVENFRATGGFPCEGLALPGLLPWIQRSDHYAFGQQGWPAVVVTDTGPLRNHEHGEMTDTPDRLNYGKMAKATLGLLKLVEKMAQRGASGVSVLN